PPARPAQLLPARREPQRAARAAARRRGAEPPGRDARGAAPALEPRDHDREAAADRAVRAAGARCAAGLAGPAPAAPADRRALAARVAQRARGQRLRAPPPAERLGRRARAVPAG